MTPRKGYYKDLTGKKFGMWTVLSFYKKEKGKHSVWLCKCECGTTRPVVQPNLVGEGGSCGCNCGNWMTPLRKGWIEDDIGYLPSTRGKIARVSPHRVEELSQWHWQASLDANGDFYIHRWATDEFGNEYRLHLARHILGMERSDRREADHVDMDSLNNLDDNLRPLPRKHHTYNRRVRSDSRTGVKGVFFNGRKTGEIYSSKITHEGICVQLGSSSTIEEAAEKYAEGSRKFHGKFGRIK